MHCERKLERHFRDCQRVVPVVLLLLDGLKVAAGEIMRVLAYE